MYQRNFLKSIFWSGLLFLLPRSSLVEGEDEENSSIPCGVEFDHDVLYEQHEETIDYCQSGKWIDKMMQTPRDKEGCNPYIRLSNMVFITIA